MSSITAIIQQQEHQSTTVVWEDCCQFAIATASGFVDGCDGNSYPISVSASGYMCAPTCTQAYSLAYQQATAAAINLFKAEVINPTQTPPCSEIN